jgi:nitrogen fixation protein NifU and related proteins
MSDLRELYQQVILDHNKSPRNFKVLEHANHSSEGFNPLCGDHINVYLKMDGDRIDEITFQGSGCAISKASASLMTAAVKGKTRQEAEEMFTRFHDLVTGDPQVVPDTSAVGKLAVFAGVREYPTRIKCATLAWHTLHAALDDQGEPITTE